MLYFFGNTKKFLHLVNHMNFSHLWRPEKCSRVYQSLGAYLRKRFCAPRCVEKRPENRPAFSTLQISRKSAESPWRYSDVPLSSDKVGYIT